MRYNDISITDMKEDTLNFYPPAIQSVKITTEFITIEYWDDIVNAKTKTYLIQRENYFFPHWDSFINNLRRIFEL